MSIKSTYEIDRQTAISVILSKVNSCTNKELENILEGFEKSYFRNYLVHDELPEEESAPYRITRVEEF